MSKTNFNSSFKNFLMMIFIGLSCHSFAGEEKEDDPFTAFFNPKKIDYPDPDPLINNVFSRKKLSLNGKWNIVLDPKSVTTTGGVQNNRKSKTGFELIEYSFDDKNQLNVPGDWNTQQEKLFFYDKAIWYQKSVEYFSNENEKQFLYFGAVNFTADVYVNGTLIGRHKGGYSPFNFEITKNLNDGINNIAVRVDGRLGKSTIPTELIDWHAYAGLVRDVSIISLPEMFIQQYQISLVDHNTGEVEAWVQLNSESASKEIKITIPKANSEVISRTDKYGRASFKFKLHNLNLWSPETPSLYNVKISTINDSIEDKIGFRTIKSKGSDILLNGNSIFLKGISMHEESILKAGIAFDKNDAVAMLGIVKNLGANYIRLAHYTHNEHTIRKADELGLLVWSEIPIYWGIDWKNPNTKAIASEQLSGVIKRDRNRASVIIWSMANETPNIPDRLKFIKDQIKITRSLDHTRLIAAALFGNPREFADVVIPRVIKSAIDDPKLNKEKRNKLSAYIEKNKALFEKNTSTILLDDPLGEFIDIIGYNEYFGWYYSAFLSPMLPLDEKEIREYMFLSMPHFRFKNIFDKPIVISEFGAGSKQDFHSTEIKLWSEEYQEKVYKYQLLMLSKSDQIKGISPWILKDFRSPMRNLNVIQAGFNRKGIIDEEGHKKKAYFVLKDFYLKLN